MSLRFIGDFSESEKDFLNEIVTEGERLASVRLGHEQVSNFYHEGKNVFSVIEGSVDEVEEEYEGVVKAQWSELDKRPFRLDMSELSSSQIDMAVELLEDIVTEAYPEPQQIRNMIELAEDASSLKTQVMRKTCDNLVCICPLAWSPVGCLNCLDFEMIDNGNGYDVKGVRNENIHSKKVVRMLSSSLRQRMSIDELRRKLSAETQEVLSTAYEGIKRESDES